jgi:hypothetical protein
MTDRELYFSDRGQINEQWLRGWIDQIGRDGTLHWQGLNYARTVMLLQEAISMAVSILGPPTKGTANVSDLHSDPRCRQLGIIFQELVTRVALLHPAAHGGLWSSMAAGDGEVSSLLAWSGRHIARRSVLINVDSMLRPFAPDNDQVMMIPKAWSRLSKSLGVIAALVTAATPTFNQKPLIFFCRWPCLDGVNQVGTAGGGAVISSLSVRQLTSLLEAPAADENAPETPDAVDTTEVPF